MIKYIVFSKSSFLVTFFVLLIVLLRDQKYVSIAIFTIMYVVGFSSQNKRYFWEGCLVFFGTLSIIYSFRIFGGLEPNSYGLIYNGIFFNFKFLLFLLLIFSTFISLFSGLKCSKRRSGLDPTSSKTKQR